jgi:hypothetical protein
LPSAGPRDESSAWWNSGPAHGRVHEGSLQTAQVETRR